MSIAFIFLPNFYGIKTHQNSQSLIFIWLIAAKVDSKTMSQIGNVHIRIQVKSPMIVLLKKYEQFELIFPFNHWKHYTMFPCSFSMLQFIYFVGRKQMHKSIK